MNDSDPITGAAMRELGAIRPMAPAGREVFVFGKPVKHADGTVLYPLSFYRNRYVTKEFCCFRFADVIQTPKTIGELRALLEVRDAECSR